MKKTALFIMFFTLLINSWATAFAGEDDSTAEIWSTVPYFHWFATTELTANDYVFLLNGSPAAKEQITIDKYKNTLHIRFVLQHGENTIAINRQAKTIFHANVFHAPSFESEIVPDEAELKIFHTKISEEQCKSCHRLDSIKKDIIPAKINQQICNPCHKHSFDEYTVYHKPAVVQWRCLLCHKAEYIESDISPDQPLRYAIEEGSEVAPLCYKCHKRKRQQIDSFSNIHGPIGMDGCNLCHNPHGSTEPKLLQQKVTTLCVNCHEMQDILEMPFVHTIIKQRGCTACHDPHGSNYPLQLKQDLNDLCYSCHPQIYKQKYDHPVQGHPVEAKIDPSNKEFPFTCISCHSPHASDFKNMLPEEDMMMLCAICHSMGQ